MENSFKTKKEALEHAKDCIIFDGEGGSVHVMEFVEFGHIDKGVCECNLAIEKEDEVIVIFHKPYKN